MIKNSFLGKTLGDIKLEKFEGSGAAGMVFSGFCPKLKKKVAVKVLCALNEEEKIAFKRFRQESRAGKQLEHDNIVKIYRSGKKGMFPYIIMEYVDGQTLKDVVFNKKDPSKSEKMPIKKACKILSQVCDGLDYLHENGIIHRDVKCSNILIAKDGTVKLADLGTIKKDNVQSNERLTKTGEVIGTLQYVAPEQIEGETKTQSDIYSLGVMFYLMLTGRYPFEEKYALALLAQHLKEEPVAPREVNKEIPKDLSSLIIKMLNKNEFQRIQTGSEVKKVLAKYTKKKQTSLFSWLN